MNRHLFVRLAFWGLLTPWLGGCGAFYTYKHVDMVVYDAETSQPLPGANVFVYYRYERGWYPPPLNEPSDAGRFAVTDQMGRAKLDVATLASGIQVNRWRVYGGWGHCTTMEIRMNTTKSISIRTRPQITIIVPNGYRGLLRIDVQPAKALVQETPGKRQFTFEASSTGYVRIDATPLLLDHFVWVDERSRPGPAGILSGRGAKRPEAAHSLSTGVGRRRRQSPGKHRRIAGQRHA